MNAQLIDLRNDYRAEKIVPFIGAGLSAPFKVPTWGNLIEQVTKKYAVGKLSYLNGLIAEDLSRYDYWRAIDNLKYYTGIEDQDIQSEIVRLIKLHTIDIKDDNLHNYLDINRMNFNLHLTTNYEHLLFKYLNCENIPISLKEIILSSQDLFDTKRVCHLHGHTTNPGSIVISKESYTELYENRKYEELFKAVTASKRLLFMGFSFDDKFIRNLIRAHKEYLNGTHYIILNKPNSDKIKELRRDYGLIAIGYEADNSSHPEEIRKILKYMSETEDSPTYDTANSTKGNQTVIIGAGINDIDRNVESNLFYKKLVIEDIDPDLIDLCSDFFIAADLYIRDLKASGFSVNIIEAMLRKVLTKYKERFNDTYKVYGDSQEFLKVVHETLEKIDFGRLAKSISENEISDEDENRGLIHLLADDEKKRVWWGEKRLNEANQVEENKIEKVDSSKIN
ncbi:SIR2 family protein [Bacillus sp. PK3-056]|uniref:ABC-three component system protein n=1 Tax=Niallia circulans TaxID=1397 RepID=UPI000F45A2F0|nr:ABC-three component system protein [Niallia circulans]AYV72918.1 SIR2 family protein [Niallia circulans]